MENNIVPYFDIFFSSCSPFVQKLSINDVFSIFLAYENVQKCSKRVF